MSSECNTPSIRAYAARPDAKVGPFVEKIAKHLGNDRFGARLANLTNIVEDTGRIQLARVKNEVTGQEVDMMCGQAGVKGFRATVEYYMDAKLPSLDSVGILLCSRRVSFFYILVLYFRMCSFDLVIFVYFLPTASKSLSDDFNAQSGQKETLPRCAVPAF